MSDRKLLIEMVTLDKHPEQERLQLFMDGESGTWRLFVGGDYACIDFSLEHLREFSSSLQAALRDVDGHPESFNAEVRRATMND